MKAQWRRGPAHCCLAHSLLQLKTTETLSNGKRKQKWSTKLVVGKQQIKEKEEEKEKEDKSTICYLFADHLCGGGFG